MKTGTSRGEANQGGAGRSKDSERRGGEGHTHLAEDGGVWKMVVLREEVCACGGVMLEAEGRRDQIIRC